MSALDGELAELGVQEPVEPRTLHLGENDRRSVFAVPIAAHGEHDFVAEIIAEAAQLVDHLGQLRTVLLLLPPGAQNLARLQPVIEQPLSFGQRGAKIRDGRIEDRVGIDVGQQRRIVTQAGRRHRFEAFLDGAEFAEQRDIARGIAAPGYSILNGGLGDARVGSNLVAGLQHLRLSALLHFHGAFDDGDARSFGPAVDGEDGAFDGNSTVGRQHVQ